MTWDRNKWLWKPVLLKKKIIHRQDFIRCIFVPRWLPEIIQRFIMLSWQIAHSIIPLLILSLLIDFPVFVTRVFMKCEKGLYRRDTQEKYILIVIAAWYHRRKFLTQGPDDGCSARLNPYIFQPLIKFIAVLLYGIIWFAQQKKLPQELPRTLDPFCNQQFLVGWSNSWDISEIIREFAFDKVG